jgi:hypothetical protein
MTDDEERVVVKTYVPRSQKERWVEHADALGMSQSEFLRSMVQAGRRGFDPDPEESDTADATPGGGALEDRVRAAVANAGVLGWEALVDRLVGDVERDLDEALGRLQDAGRVRYSGREGGYVLAGAADEATGDGRGEGGTERGPSRGRRGHGEGRQRDDERPDDRRRSEPRDDGRGPSRERRPSGRRDDSGEDHRGGRRRERPPDDDRRAPTRRAGRRPRYDAAESRPADDYEDEGRPRRADGRDEEGGREREDRREGDSRRDERGADRRGRR